LIVDEIKAIRNNQNTARMRVVCLVAMEKARLGGNAMKNQVS